MHNPPTAAEAEAHLRRLLADNEMPQPDEVLHHPAEVVFLFHEKKLAVTVELTDGWLDNANAVRADAWESPSSQKAAMREQEKQQRSRRAWAGVFPLWVLPEP